MSNSCLNKANFNIICYDNNDRPYNITVVVGLFHREKSMFKRPTAPLYVEVVNGGKSQQKDFYEMESAQYSFIRVCAYWGLYSRYEIIVHDIENTGFSHWFYNDSLDYTLDTMPLLKRSDLYSGLTPTTTSLEYNLCNNQFTVFLLYCPQNSNELKGFAEQFKSVELKLSSKEQNIAWKITNNNVILCRYNYIEDFDNVYNNKIQVTEELYKHSNPQKFTYIALPTILATIADPILCKNPLFW